MANKLGKPASRVRLYISGSSALASSVVGGSSVVSSSSGASSTISFDGGSSSGSLSNMALVEGGSLAVRYVQHSVAAGSVTNSYSGLIFVKIRVIFCKNLGVIRV